MSVPNWSDATDNDVAATQQQENTVENVADHLAQTNLNNDNKEEGVNNGIDAADESAEVEVKGQNIYAAAETFEQLGLSESLLQGVYKMGFVKPSKIQAQALPIVLARNHENNLQRHNLIGQAHHGSGKTATYTLSMLSMVDENLNFPQAVCVCPTRELAIQVASVTERLACYTKIKVCVAIAGSERNKSITQQIVVGTPGTIIGKMTHREFDAKKVRILVLDEADQMLKTDGFAADSLKIRKLCNAYVQVLLFSATYAENVQAFASKFAPDATKIVIKRTELKLKNVQQFYVQCGDAEEKYQAMKELYALSEFASSIIFSGTIASAKYLTERMTQDGFKVSLLHGELEPSIRDQVMHDFRVSNTTVLITTNVLARGIDVPQVALVINYEMPFDRSHNPDPETYIHRVGRAGRFGRKGVAVNLADSSESFKAVKFLEEYFQFEIKPLSTDNIESIKDFM